MCDHCKKTVEKIALNTKDVDKAEVTLDKKELYIEFNDSFREDELVNSINEAGYKVIK